MAGSSLRAALGCMKRLAVTAVLGLVLFSANDAVGAPRLILLKPEARTFLQVGHTAVLHIPRDRRYSGLIGNIGPDSTLKVVRRTRYAVFYRAVKPGPEVIVGSPVTKPGECISCATLHWFVTVIPK